MTTTNLATDRLKFDELKRRVEALEHHYDVEPKTFLEDPEERIEKLEKNVEQDG